MAAEGAGGGVARPAVGIIKHLPPPPCIRSTFPCGYKKHLLEIDALAIFDVLLISHFLDSRFYVFLVKTDYFAPGQAQKSVK